MKSNKRIQMPRAVVAASLMTALAVPALAGAKPVGADNVIAQRYENSAAVTTGHTYVTTSKPYELPASFRSDIASSARVPVKQAYALPSDFQSETAQSAPSTGGSSSPTIVREVRTVTVTQDTSHTLA